ncbi:MAG: hypothetical protein ACW98I_17165 [Candidatus Hodarchaeales archaeon]
MVLPAKSIAQSTPTYSAPTTLVEFTGHYWDAGIDNDMNGRYDGIRILIEVNVIEEGYYTLILELISLNSSDLEWHQQGRVEGYWNNGFSNISVVFSSRVFVTIRQDTSYVVLKVEISHMTGIVAVIDSPYTTQRYNYDEFELPEALLSGDYSDYGRDPDSDDKYEQIVIQCDVNIVTSGRYTLNLVLNLRPIPNRWSEGNIERTSTGFWEEGLSKISIYIESATLLQSYGLGDVWFSVAKAKIVDSNQNIIDVRLYDSYTTRTYKLIELETEVSKIPINVVFGIGLLMLIWGFSRSLRRGKRKGRK